MLRTKLNEVVNSYHEIKVKHNLKVQHKQVRLYWDKRNRDWSAGEWSETVYSNESKIGVVHVTIECFSFGDNKMKGRIRVVSSFDLHSLI